MQLKPNVLLFFGIKQKDNVNIRILWISADMEIVRRGNQRNGKNYRDDLIVFIKGLERMGSQVISFMEKSSS